MSTFDTGREAEKAAADYLVAQGYEVIDQNWRTRYCEIDLVAKKKNTVLFVEVKYRKTSAWGGGLDYILPKKLKQMRFAAEMWIAEHDWKGDYSLAAIEVSGNDFTVTNFLDNI